MQSTIFLMPEGTLIRTTYKNNKQKPPFVPNSTKSGFLSFYFRSKEPCGSLFRQVLFVLERVPDVLDCCALKPYEPLLIVLFQYTTYRILSQIRCYFKGFLCFWCSLPPFCKDCCRAYLAALGRCYFRKFTSILFVLHQQNNLSIFLRIYHFYLTPS